MPVKHQDAHDTAGNGARTTPGRGGSQKTQKFDCHNVYSSFNKKATKRTPPGPILGGDHAGALRAYREPPRAKRGCQRNIQENTRYLGSSLKNLQCFNRFWPTPRGTPQ